MMTVASPSSSEMHPTNGFSLRGWITRILPGTIVLIILAMLYRRLLAGRVLAGGDLHSYFFPNWMAVVRVLHDGRLPLWTPYLFAGAPLLANSQLGVFYPLNWPFWALCGSSPSGVARALHWSLLLHLGLAAFTSYSLARRLGAGRWGAALSGLLYAGSGYLGLHVEHLNQLQALAWLPLIVLPGRDDHHGMIRAWFAILPTPINILSFTLILLAGHTQMAFIAGIALVAWRLGLEIQRSLFVAEGMFWERLRGFVRQGLYSIVGLLPFVLAAALAAVQLLPTFELARFSMRSGGLSWRDAVSFSVSPWDLPRALLPLYVVSPLLPEGVAYVGLVGMALAGWGAWYAYRRRDRYGFVLAGLGLLGLFLALGAYNPLYQLAARLRVPGVIHFRAPARFLALYVLAVALLAGRGMDALLSLARRDWQRWLLYALSGLAGAELLLCGESLPHAAATALRTYTDLRPATAHLIASARQSEDEGVPPGRFLSISKTLFDAGDERAVAALYGNTLSEEALWAYNVASKAREVLSPNFPLAFEVPAVDGYDGGLLPLHHYGVFSRLLLPGGTQDGRLRENLEVIPPARWLSLLGVQFVITDKTGDTWADDVFYDRQFQPSLAAGETLSLAWLPGDFEASALGLLYKGTGEVLLQLQSGEILSRTLLLDAGDAPGRIRWEGTQVVESVTLLGRDSGLTLSGASLIDERTGAFYSLVLSPHVRLVHSGDVKVYESAAVLPRAFFVSTYHCAASDEAALQSMQIPDFDPASQAVISNCDPAMLGRRMQSMITTSAHVDMLKYSSVEYIVDVTSDSGGILVLTDAWYPGWSATLSPQSDDSGALSSAPLLRADLLFKAVLLEPGAWRVTFTYRPSCVLWGTLFSIVGLTLFCGYWRGVRWRFDHFPS